MLSTVALVLGASASTPNRTDCHAVHDCGKCAAIDGCAWCAHSNLGAGWIFECLNDNGDCYDMGLNGFTVDTPKECECYDVAIRDDCSTCAAKEHCSWCPETMDHLGGCATTVQASGANCRFLKEDPITNATACPLAAK